MLQVKPVFNRGAGDILIKTYKRFPASGLRAIWGSHESKVREGSIKVLKRAKFK